jgi:hypothetical protein
MGRDVGSHAYGDAARPVHQQVGDLCREHGRLPALVVEGGLEIDGVTVDVFQHRHGHTSQSRLGVSIRRRRVTIH